MARNTVRLVLLFAVAMLLAGPSPAQVRAEGGTPGATPEALGTPPAVGTPLAAPEDACDPAAFPAGGAGITYQPAEDFGFVRPAEAHDHNLYLTVDTLAPGACGLYSPGTVGAATFFVLEGTIEFLAWPGGPDPEDVEIYAGNDQGNTVEVAPGAPVTLQAGDWATVDREADFVFRNGSSAEATVITAIYEHQTGVRNGCSGGCRRRP